jgi:O-antigen/teichoic acid export membrane protein
MRLKTIGQHTLVYTGGIVIGKLASFIMLPIYTRFLTPSDYGVLELLGMTIDVIGMITGAGIVAGVFKFYHAVNTPAEQRLVISTAGIGVAAAATITSCLGLLLAPQLCKIVFGSETYLFYLRLYFILYFLQNFEQVPLALLRAENRAVLFVSINTLKLVVVLSLNILFVVHLRMGINGVLASSIITTGIVVLGETGYLVRRAGLRFGSEVFRQMVRFGVPMIPWWVGNFVLVFSDRYFLNYYRATAVVGIYSLAYKFAFLLHTLAFAPFSTMWDAQRFEVAKLPNGMQIFVRVFLYVNVVLGITGLALSLFVRDFLSLMSAPAFHPAYRLVPILIAAQIAFTWGAYWSLGIYLSGKTNVLATGSAVLILVTLILNYLLIPKFGAFGAALATFGAYTLRFLWIYYASQASYPVKYAWGEMGKFYAILAMIAVIGFVYHPDQIGVSIGWNVGLLIFGIGLVYIVVLPAQDRAALATFTAGGLPAIVRRLRGNRAYLPD